jgi:hypothetical protein
VIADAGRDSVGRYVNRRPEHLAGRLGDVRVQRAGSARVAYRHLVGDRLDASYAHRRPLRGVPRGQAIRFTGEGHFPVIHRYVKVRGVDSRVVRQFVDDVGLHFLVVPLCRLCHSSTMALWPEMRHAIWGNLT